jgi:hypothetical protein
MAGTFLDDRQVVNRAALSALGNTANLTLDVIMGDINTFFANATASATASVLMERDANANTRANNFIEGFTTTATAATATTLTVASTYFQQFTGTTTQTVVLPNATTLVAGQAFLIANRSTGIVTVNANGGGLIQTMAANSQAIFTATSIGTSAGTWDSDYSIANALSNPMTAAGQMIYGGSSGTPLSVAAGTTGQSLISNGTSAPTFETLPGNSTALKAPTITNLTSTGTQTGTLFYISAPASNVTAGATYTNNSNTFTLLASLTTFNTGWVAFFSGTGATTGSTLTKSSGTGPTTLTFSATQNLATYTSPSGPASLYLKIKMAGGGGGGGGAGGTGDGQGGTGNPSTFGSLELITLGGSGGYNGNASSTPGLGGSAAYIGSPALTVAALPGGNGTMATIATTTTFQVSGSGGSTPYFNGGGFSSYADTGGSGAANTGGGGAGAGGPSTSGYAGHGGGSGAFAEAIINSPLSTYYYSVGTGGAGGNAGSSPTGNAGGAGGAGIIVVEEHYQ